MKFFSGSVDAGIKALRSASVSAIYLTRASGRLFAITFGHARHFLQPGVIEERFGLRTTLNSVDALQLRAVDVATLESNPFHAKRQASREAPLGDFGLNLDQDLLRAVTGKPVDPNLGSQMTGIDSLTVRVRVSLGGLKELLVRYLKKSEERGYQDKFPWVDHVSEVRDPVLTTRLYEEVARTLREGRSDGIWAAIPEVVDWTIFDSFRFGSPGTTNGYEDVTVDRMLDSLGDAPISLDLLRKKRVFCMAEGSRTPRKSWTYLQCLTAEIPHDGQLYLLNANAWYRIDADFAGLVDADIKAIPVSSVPLPMWGDEREDIYNRRVAQSSGGDMALMDRVMIKHPGMASPIEFCDLLTADRKMIHVKRYGQSSILSHLFMQGLVSANCLLSDRLFREAVNAKLPKSHKLPNPSDRPTPERFEVMYAIGSSEGGPLKLPFFSRVTLRNAFHTLTNSLGFKVTVTKIKIDKLISTQPRVGSRMSTTVGQH